MKTAPKTTPTDFVDMMRELASGIRDVIEETQISSLKEDPEEAFIDLACRLVFRLRETLAVVPAAQVAAAQKEQSEAAARILGIFTKWMLEHPECSYVTRVSVTGKFQIVVRSPSGTKLFFGETVQDAYAQAAQTILFKGGSL